MRTLFRKETWMPGIVTALFATLVFPARANALQAHAYPGLYVHMLAHLFFLVAMIGFGLRIQRTWLSARASWRSIAWAAWLMALWNVWAMGGHLVELAIDPGVLLRSDAHEIPDLLLAGWKEKLYYLLKMDHLVSLPALVFLYRGLSGIARERFAEELADEGRVV